MKWYRMYSEARNDAKLRALSDSQHRVWFNLLCLAGEQTQRGTITGYDDDLLAVEVANGDITLLHETLTRLEKLRMIAKKEEGIFFSSWEKRQYDNPSDRPKAVAERVKKSRSKAKSNERQGKNYHNETDGNDNVTPCNDSETNGSTLYTDTDTDTDSDTETDSYSETEEKESLLPPLPSTRKIQEPVVVVVGGRDLYVFKSVIDLYMHYFVRDPNQTIKNLLHSYLDDEVHMDMLAWAMRDAAEKGKDWNYAKGTLNNLFSRGIRTAEQAELADQEYKQSRVQKRGSNVVQLVDKLPASVQRQQELQQAGTFATGETRKIADDPELSEMLERLRSSKIAGN